MSNEFLSKFGSTEHIQKILDNGHYFPEHIYQNPHTTSEQLEHITPDPENMTRTWEGKMLIHHPNFPESIKRTFLTSAKTGSYFASESLKHPSINKEDLLHAAEHSKIFQLSAHLYNHPLADKDVVSAGMKNENINFRVDALASPHHTREHVEQGLKDPSISVRQRALRSPHIKKEELINAAYDEDDRIRLHSILHPEFPKEHLEDISKHDPLTDVRERARSI